MALDATGILTAVQDHALASGLFETVNLHEAKNAPGNGLRAEIWVQSISPVPAGSGLKATTARIELTLRIRSNMLQEPQDAIDPAIISAVDVLMTAYSGDFTLGGKVRNVDLLGATPAIGSGGGPLQAQAGYLNQDGKLFRVMDITLPLVVNDVWEQIP